MVMCLIQIFPIKIDKATHCLNIRLHGHEHATDICMIDNRGHFPFWHSGPLPLFPVTCIFNGLLICPLRNSQPLDAYIEPCTVHHSEHASHTLVLAPNQVADTISIVTVRHHRGRARVNTYLFFQRNTFKVISSAKTTVVIHQKFWHDKQRYAAGSCWSARGTGQDKMDDILTKFMIPVGDENFLTRDTPASIFRRFGF